MTFLNLHSDIIQAAAGKITHVEELLERMKKPLPRVTFKEAEQLFKV